MKVKPSIPYRGFKYISKKYNLFDHYFTVGTVYLFIEEDTYTGKLKLIDNDMDEMWVDKKYFKEVYPQDSEKIKKLRKFCEDEGFYIETAPKSLTGLNDGYLILEEDEK